jgi:hypothetical protein
MITQTSAKERIIAEVGSWPGVTVAPGDFSGETSILIRGWEIGHLHGDRAAHFSFPKPLWDQLRNEGRISPHPIFPKVQGPAARAIRSEEDVQDVIQLLRLQYNSALARLGDSGKS